MAADGRAPRRAAHLVLAAALWSSPGAAELVAEQLDGMNLGQRPTGSDAIAGRGDWLLTNGELCAAISGAGHETGLSLSGGWLIDLGHCGRGDDQFTYTHLLPGMQREAILPVVDIRGRVGDDWASVIVIRADESLRATVRYTLKRSQPRRLFVRSELERRGPGADLSLLGQLWLHPHRALVPFSINTRDRSFSVGYRHPGFDPADKSDALNAMLPVDLTVLVGEPEAGPGISYGLLSKPGLLISAEGERRTLSQYTLVEEDFTNQIWLSRPLWFGGGGKPGRLELLQSLFMDLRVGETLRLQQEILVGEASDVASITDHIYQGAWLSGELDTGEARVAVYDEAGRPVTDAVPDPSGRFRLRLPAGLPRCDLEVRTPWEGPRRIAVELTGGDRRLALIETSPPARVRLPRGAPLRLVFKGRDGTPDPQFPGAATAGGTDAGTARGNFVSLTGGPDDERTLALPPGRYRVYASRGLEYTAAALDIEVERGSSVDLRFPPLRKVVDSEGWVSVDFHVHSGLSFDSAMAPGRRLKSFVAQGADLLVATEHDYVADLAGLAASLGLSDQLTVIPGAELTGMARAGAAPRTIGHLNAFPLTRDPEAFAGGVPLHEGRRLRQVVAELRGPAPGALVQLNHPRTYHGAGEDLAFFDHLSVGEHFEPRLPLGNVQNRSLIEVDPVSGLRDLDFDTLELANGASLAEYQQVRADWLSLLLQGEYRPAVASSDSHEASIPVAIPRSYVRYAGPRRHPLDVAAVVDAVRAGAVIGSTGPLPELQLEDEQGVVSGVGATAGGRRFTLRLRAQAAPWVDVSQVWVYVNGSVLRGTTIRAGEWLSLPLEIERDSFVTVEFYGEAGETYRSLAPGHTPMAFTNPIWIDADRDGRWTPPGLRPLPLAVSRPASIPSAPPEEVPEAVAP